MRPVATVENFSISTLLKDIIGQDLVTNDFVAIFELVKNSIDAGAKTVRVEVGTDNILVSDDGKGMSEKDIREKWLWVAYSAKADGSEDSISEPSFRDKISHQGRYAGSKGIGRFSCDRLARKLDMYTRPIDQAHWSHLSVDWTKFEVDQSADDAVEKSKTHFEDVNVDLSEARSIPPVSRGNHKAENGTIMALTGLRSNWDEQRVTDLKETLAKLVDPFQPSDRVKILLSGPNFPEVQVGNHILDILETKTTWIDVKISGEWVESSLSDRGLQIFKIRERNETQELSMPGVSISARVYFLNTAAKNNFTRRVGVQPNKFGHIFLFVNGFRVFPIGEEENDFWGMGYRKQQGSARYLGPRDVIGKVDISSPRLMFREASSRDAGLIENSAVLSMKDAVEKYALRRLEKYVNGIAWKDKLDRFREDASGLDQPQARARLVEVLSSLLGSRNVEVLEFAEHLFSLEIPIDDASGMDRAIRDLSRIAEETGSEEVLLEVERARRAFDRSERLRREALAEAEAATDALEQAEKSRTIAETRAEQAETYSELLEDQARQLSLSARVDPATLEAFNHQASLYSTSMRQHALLSVEICRDVVETLKTRTGLNKEVEALSEAISNMERVAFLGSRIAAVTKVATRALFDIQDDWTESDIVRFMQDYISDVAVRNLKVGFAIFESNGIEWQCRFRPLDITIVIDNLIDNARKSPSAKSIRFSAIRTLRADRPQISVIDDGEGLLKSRVDVSRIFEPGYSTRSMGTGLGLSQSRTAMREMHGDLTLDDGRIGETAAFLITLPPRLTRS